VRILIIFEHKRRSFYGSQWRVILNFTARKSSTGSHVSLTRRNECYKTTLRQASAVRTEWEVLHERRTRKNVNPTFNATVRNLYKNSKVVFIYMPWGCMRTEGKAQQIPAAEHMEVELYTRTALPRKVPPLVPVLLKPSLDGAWLVQWRDVTCSANTSEQKR
jgi:hypothetical protein